jgi:enediyne biosynthesis protein E4
MIEQHRSGVQYAEPLLVFLNEGGRLKNISDSAGSVFRKRFHARGLAIWDYDNDGRVDAIVGINHDVPLRNTAAAGHHWIGVRLKGKRANRNGIGARISWSAGGSYLSSHDLRMVLGLGTADSVEWVEVRWPGPGKRIERFSGLARGDATL